MADDPKKNETPPPQEGCPPQGMPQPELQTGMLRQDIELIPPGEHGAYAILFDPAADAYYKISERSMDIISRIDRSYPLMTFLEMLNNCGMQVTKDELLQLIAFLHQNNLIAPEYGQMEKKYAQYVQMQEDTRFLRLSSAYLFFRLPPWRPERFYNFIRPAVSWLASKFFLLLLLIPAVIGYVLILRQFPEVRATFLDSLSWAGLANYFMAILVMKVVHEAAHSLAAIHFNCRVRGVGIGFMVFYPRLYTDTTDSWRLPRRQRLLIDAAGIIIELLVGGIAALVWVYSPPGPWRSTMFYIFAVSTISTIFVNGNPCIRYDGYYILCDITNMENLMTRSGEYVKQWWRWHFLRLGTSPKEERGTFLFVFGVCSFIYRIFLYTSIILVIYNQFVKAVALVMLVLELYSILIYPMYREIKTIRMLSKKSANKARFILFFVLAAVIAGILFLPLSWNVDLPGEVVPENIVQVTVQEGGYLQGDLPHQPVEWQDYKMRHQGENGQDYKEIFELKSPSLEFSRNRANADWTYLRQLSVLQSLDKKYQGELKITREKLKATLSNQDELNRRLKLLNLLNESVQLPDNWIYLPRIPGRSHEGLYLPKGALVSEVVSPQKVVYAYAQDRDVKKIKINDRVRIRVSDALKEHYGRVVAIDSVPAKLRNSALLQQFGGPVPVYIDEKKVGEYTSVLPLYRIEIHFDEQPDLQIGRTLKIEIIHEERLYDSLKRYLISVFRKEF